MVKKYLRTFLGNSFSNLKVGEVILEASLLFNIDPFCSRYERGFVFSQKDLVSPSRLKKRVVFSNNTRCNFHVWKRAMAFPIPYVYLEFRVVFVLFCFVLIIPPS